MSVRLSPRPAIWILGAAASIGLILWLDRVTLNEYSFEIFYGPRAHRDARRRPQYGGARRGGRRLRVDDRHDLGGRLSDRGHELERRDAGGDFHRES
jgi:hypothetical protein